MSKQLHAVIRLDIEQKTEADGSYMVPVAYVEIQSYPTKWRADKEKTLSIMRTLMRSAKAPRTGYPKFGLVSASEEHVKAFLASRVGVSPAPSSASVLQEMPPVEQPQEVVGDQPFVPPVYDPAGNWPEDFPHEDGNYQDKCAGCGKWFTGHKRRIHCKVCMEADHGK